MLCAYVPAKYFRRGKDSINSKVCVYALEPNPFERIKVEPNVLPPTATAVLSMTTEHTGFRESYLECCDLHDASAMQIVLSDC